MDRFELEIDEFIKRLEELDETMAYGTATPIEWECLEESDVRNERGEIIATLCRIY